jgi:hypothetical protein
MAVRDRRVQLTALLSDDELAQIEASHMTAEFEPLNDELGVDVAK